MTHSLLDYDPNDTGDIPPLPGEITMRIDTGEKTQRIDPRIIDAPSFDAIPRRIIEIDDTVTFRIPETIGVVDLGDAYATIDGELEGPQNPPPPLPPVPDETQAQGLLTALGAADEPPGYVGRHRDPQDCPAAAVSRHPAHKRRLSPWVLAAVAVVGLAMWAGLYWAASAVWAWLSGGVW